MTMNNSDKISQEMLTDLVTIAKRINPRVDEVVQSMYPPLDARLLEARLVLCELQHENTCTGPKVINFFHAQLSKA